MSRIFGGRTAGCVVVSLGLTLTAVPAQAATAPCYPDGCNPVIVVNPGSTTSGFFVLVVDNLVPGTIAVATWTTNTATAQSASYGGTGANSGTVRFANYKSVKAAGSAAIRPAATVQQTATATVQPDGTATFYLTVLDGGITTLVTVNGFTSDAAGNSVPVTRVAQVFVPVAPCTPASSCNPGVTVNPGTGTGPGAVYSVTVDNLVPGSVVTITWVANGKTQTATAVVGPDGKAVVPLPALDVGTATELTIAGFTSGANGQPVPVTRTGSVTVASPTPTPPVTPPVTTPPATTPPVTPPTTPTTTPTPPPPAGPSLFAKATAVSKYSKMKTWVSGDPAAGQKPPTLPVCRGPFKFRIQKQKITTVPSGSDEPTIRVTWTTLSGKYTTNKKSGIWYYRIVNLKKGTYRSVVASKCGLPGVTTNTVTLKK